MQETKKPLVHFKKFISFFVALTLIVTLLPLGNVKSQADEGPNLFTMLSAAPFSVSTSTNTQTWIGSADSLLEYKAGSNDWTSWDGTAAINAAQNDGTGNYIITFRGKGISVVSGGTKWVISGDGNVTLSGDIMTLCNYETVPKNVANSCFNCLFMDCAKITNISSLVLSAETAGDSSYAYMFKNCTGLTDISGLTISTTTLGSWCFQQMFSGCKNLSNAAITFPATSLTNSCYMEMFLDCKNLVTPPTLPATNLNWSCYNSMFKGCSSLTTTPALPATSLTRNCYYSMFEGCTSLTQFSDLSHVTNAESYGYCTNMFKDCGGIKVCTDGKGSTWSLPSVLADSTFFNRLVDGVPSTIEAGKNYYYMFDVTVTAGDNGSVDITSITDLTGVLTPTINDNKLKIGDKTITATPNTGYKFSSWSGLPTNTNYIAKNTNITAVFKPLHEHENVTYSAEGSAITATCNSEDDCFLPDDKISISLNAAECSYDGEAVTYGDAEATPAADILITGYDAWLYNDLAPVVKFYNSTGTEISAPSAAGEYTVKLFAAEGSDTFVSTTLTIEKVPAAVLTEPATASAITFNGSAQALLSAFPTTMNGDIYYAVSTGTSTPDSFPLTADEVKATNAGTYYVFYKIMGDDNHSAKAFGPVEVSIAKRTPDFNSLSAETVKATEVTLSTITGIESLLYGINTTSDVPETENWQSSNVFSGLTKNTSYYFFAKCDSDSNNNSSISSLGTLITTSDIDESEITGISAKDDINTDGIPYGTAITVALLTNGTPVLTDAPTAEVTYSYVGVAPTTYEKSTTPPTGIGTYKLVVDMLDDSYYGVKEFEFKIVKTTPSVPSGVKATAPTSSSAADGSITGLDETMEYALYDNSSKSYGEYQNVTDSAITGLEAGTKIKVRVKETETSNASADKELTVPSYKAPVIFTPIPAPAVETLTVPVKGDNTIRISATIKDGNATINEIKASDIEKAFEKKSGETSDEPQNTTMTIDISEAPQNVNGVTLTRKTVETLVEAVNDKKNPLKTVEIKLPEVSITLDQKALEAVAEQAGTDIVLVVENTGVNSLNATQQNALKNRKVSSVFDAHIESNGIEIHNFNGGIAEVSIKFLREAGRDFKHYFIYYVADNGSMEKLSTRFENNRIIFKTGHLSDYVIIYDENEENDTYMTEDSADKSDSSAEAEEVPAAEPVKPEVKAPTDAQIAKNSLKLNKGLKVTSNEDGIKVSWGKVADADGYIVYAAYCGKSNKKVKTIKDADVSEFVITELNGKALNLKKNFKVLVKAYKLIDGKKVVLGKTVTAHIAGCENKKYSNPKAIKLLSDSKLTLNAGESFVIEAKTVLADKSKKSLSDSHAKEFRFASNNTKIAVVDAEGNITAKKAGKCYLYVYARNGFTKRISVVVE